MINRKCFTLLILGCIFYSAVFGILGDIGGYGINVDSPAIDINPAEYLRITYRVVNYGYIFQQDSLNGNIFGETLKNDFSFNHSHPAIAGVYYPFSFRKERRFGLFLFSRLIGTSYLDLKQENANLYVYDYPQEKEMKLDLQMERDEITSAYGFGFAFEVTPRLKAGFMIEKMETESNRLFMGYAVDSGEDYEYTYINKTKINADALLFNLGFSLDLKPGSRIDLLLTKIEGMNIEIEKELTGRYVPDLPPIMSGFEYYAEDNYSLKFPVRIKLTYIKQISSHFFRLDLEIIPGYENSGTVFTDYPHLSSRFHEVKNPVFSPKIRYAYTFIKENDFNLSIGSELSYKKSQDPMPDEENGKTYSDQYVSNSDLAMDYYKLGADVNIFYKLAMLKIGLLTVSGKGKLRAYDIQSNKTAISDISAEAFVLICNLTFFF
ncbi:MAG: hypothetical protein PHV06_08275 [bacterium]|nr:hypothetical protein [bacterium]